MSLLLLATAEIFQPPVAQKDILLGDKAVSLFRAVPSNVLIHDVAVDLHRVCKVL